MKGTTWLLWVVLAFAAIWIHIPSVAMMNNDPGMCDILCGGDPACYINCLYGGDGGGGTGGGGGGGGDCPCLEQCGKDYKTCVNDCGNTIGCMYACKTAKDRCVADCLENDNDC